MVNLLKETKNILKEHGKSLEDITFVQGAEFGISINKFIELANTNYDDGYGSPKVAEDLIVGGNGWWLERHEYDGSEWWEYKSCMDVLPITRKEINALTVNQSIADVSCGWETLARLNGISEE